MYQLSEKWVLGWKYYGKFCSGLYLFLCFSEQKQSNEGEELNGCFYFLNFSLCFLGLSLFLVMIMNMEEQVLVFCFRVVQVCKCNTVTCEKFKRLAV